MRWKSHARCGAREKAEITSKLYLLLWEFNILKSANQILKLLIEGYDVSWGGEDTIIFNKAEKTVHAKHATKEIYNLIFARYCIELEKRFINRNLVKRNKKK